ncbi:hypothetical protein L2088_20525 [Pseudomonas protegens]|uniref:hypothetical protein n=1 Tax=Pseudomonas protegens TaxID=380021 RepID=UPI001A929D7F|nr:hypothetical protein [Pseudomonas protegens]MCL9657096.1 hypothetical protein [Pseudomonas protegens]BCT34121.1 hypothetical protein PproGo58_36160 [Pseudomonas protegens]
MTKDELAFKKLYTIRSKLQSNKVKSTSIEVKVLGFSSRFYLSILLDEEIIKRKDCDEIVLEISSSDGVHYKVDISDSLGSIFFEKDQIIQESELMEVLEKCPELLMEAIGASINSK